MTRATVLAGVAAFSAATLGALPAVLAAPNDAMRVLRLRRAGEPVIEAPFTLDGIRIWKPGYYRLCRAFRDIHVDPIEGYVQVDPRLIDALWELQRRVDGRVLTIMSGFRTPATNEAVGGASGSLHMRAMATDFAVDGLSPIATGRILEEFPPTLVGGIGIYSDDGHVHIDTGPRSGRIWCNHSETACAP